MKHTRYKDLSFILCMSEQWKTVTGYDNYEVSNLGNVRNKKTKYVLRPFKEPYGSYRVQIHHEGRPKHIDIAQIVAKAFLPLPADKSHKLVQHKNRVRRDNRAKNLEWTNRLDYPDYFMGAPKNGWQCNVQSIDKIQDAMSIPPLGSFNDIGASINQSTNSA